jgi:D-alanine-D-alanine ligase
MDDDRFANMTRALEYGGIDAKYYHPSSMEQLECLLFIEHPDIVYSADYYIKDEANNRFSIQSILDEKSIPYIGSTPETLEFVRSKSDLKVMWRLNHVSTPAFLLVYKIGSQIFGTEALDQATDYPYILKPDREGNSRGLDESSIVFDRSALDSKLEELLQTYTEVLIERFLGTATDIREFTVAMIGSGMNKLLMPAEITLKQKKELRIVTTKDKDNHLTQASLLVEEGLKMKIIEFADRALETAGVRDYSRCDILMVDEQLYALEINGLPMIPDKWFEICASGSGLDSAQYINAIFLAAIVRNRKQNNSALQIPSAMLHFLPEKVVETLAG